MSVLYGQNVLRRACNCRNLSLPLLLRRLNHAPANSVTGALARSDKKHHTTTQSTGAGHKPGASALSKGKKGAKLSGRAEKEEELSYQEQLRQLETVAAMEHSAPFDVWSQPVDTFDLHIPAWKSRRKDASVLDHLRALWATQNNWFRNVISMYRMVQENSFPGIKQVSVWSRHPFATQSTPWFAPFRKMALSTYQDVQNAIAIRDEKTLKKFTVSAFRAHALKLARAQDPSRVCVWKFHGEKSPCRVVSLRAAQGNMSNETPKFGNRLIIQALVRFNTLQSLEIYSKRGTLIQGQETPKHVVEYLVFQKRMWQDAPWVIRDQLYEGLEGKFKRLA